MAGIKTARLQAVKWCIIEGNAHADSWAIGWAVSDYFHANQYMMKDFFSPLAVILIKISFLGTKNIHKTEDVKH